MAPRPGPDDRGACPVTLAAQARQRSARHGPPLAQPHPIPDLTGEPVEVIAQGVLGAIAAAHSGEWAADVDTADPTCGSCSALIDLASHYGDPTDMLWPDPVRRHLAELLDAELARRAE